MDIQSFQSFPHRTYTCWSYFAYWATAGICVTSWSLVSSIIGIGLSAGEPCDAVLVGSFFAALLGFMAGQCGRHHYLGFMMMSRAAFGLWGSYFSITICVFESLIFFGIQAYYGGQAVVVVLNAIFPQFLRLKNTLPKSAGITTQALLGFLIYFSSSPCTGSKKNNDPGELVKPSVSLAKVDRIFAMLASISSVAGAYTGGSVRVSDWTRYRKTMNAPVVPLITTMPVTITIGVLVGILVTSAGNSMYGEIIWIPLLLLQRLQETQYTAACRTGTFFAGLGLLSSQVFVNVTQNGFQQGMDIAAFLPRYFDIKRGAILVCIIGIVIQPWRFLSQAATFLPVLNSFGVFIAPMTGILCTDYWIVRRQRLIVADLYQPHGVYWFTFGINWRAMLAFCLGFWPSMPGFICAFTGDPVAEGWARIYQLTYFVGLMLGGGLYYVICKVWPMPGARENVLLNDETIEDVSDGASASLEAGETLL
ncbi:NCS1 family nucleobase:cation symporter-1 [Podospora fimiseda]|uniref:NCS1 family nucleobase:cation symporter-1 n=1 Tax=Podospora fimiseda TaxID=252190 RepID=A0AAN6YQ57_9PEZI|nr:NCS1 family nucleobase:cation symporter-1 [Podospora fimiseda]